MSERPESAVLLGCELCRCLSDDEARGWIGLRALDPEDDAPTTIAFFCPDCANQEFDY